MDSTRILALYLILAPICWGQADPAVEAFQAWEKQWRAGSAPTDRSARAQALLEASSGWVKRWPDSAFAWQQRREALVLTRSRESEDWKQVGEALIRLHPAHSRASSMAADWVGAGVLLKEASVLLLS